MSTIPRLIRWVNDNFPPIDLSNEFDAVMELIRAYQLATDGREELEKEVERLKGLVIGLEQNIAAYENDRNSKDNI